MTHAGLLTIGQLAQRTGVARTALRYYEDLGLLQPAFRQSGQRRYYESTVAAVGVILLLRDIGFSLSEIGQIHATRPGVAGSPWRDIAAAKIHELDDRIAGAVAARSALRHALAHHQAAIDDCPRFGDAVTGVLAGVPLRASHPH
jgi:DNA-binding transcriptional MerR regulator